jgi:uncharacterized protein YxeA
MKKIIFLIITISVLAAIGAAIFYNEVTSYAMNYNLRLSEIQNEYDTRLIDFEKDKSQVINHLQEYAAKGKASVKCSINDIKVTAKEDELQLFKVHYRTIDNYIINKYIAFITIKDGEITKTENFKDLQ